MPGKSWDSHRENSFNCTHAMQNGFWTIMLKNTKSGGKYTRRGKNACIWVLSPMNCLCEKYSLPSILGKPFYEEKRLVVPQLELVSSQPLSFCFNVLFLLRYSIGALLTCMLCAISSLSERIWERFLVPRTFLRVVCANRRVAESALVIFATARIAFWTR